MAENKNPILIRNIRHLTDARYFAAMGVDWMSIPLTEDPESFLLWHTLKEWVEGVRLAAEIDAADEILLAKTIIDAAPDGLVFSTRTVMDLPSDIQVFYEAGSFHEAPYPEDSMLIVPYTPDIMIPEDVKVFDPHFVFLQADWTKPLMEGVLASGFTGGFCFLGSEEKEKGMKDYSALDDMIYLLKG